MATLSIQTRRKMSLAKKGKKKAVYLSRICICGKSFQISSKNKNQLKSRKYCSQQCYHQYGNTTIFKKGIDHPKWKGGVYKTNNAFRRSPQYLQWTKNIYQRDNYMCQICGVKGKDLRANHIKKFSDYPELRLTLTNGITICKKCDIQLVMNHEAKWESYFLFNLETRRII